MVLDMTQLSFKQQLEATGNEDSIRERIAIGSLHGEQLGIAQEWLRRIEVSRSEASTAKRDAREEETLSIAKDANRIASRAERWAMYAAIAAVIALIISIVRSQN